MSLNSSDIMVYISNFLELKDIYSLGVTSRQLKETMTDELIWKHMYYRLTCRMIGNCISKDSVENDVVVSKKKKRISYKSRVKDLWGKRILKNLGWNDNYEKELKIITKTIEKLIETKKELQGRKKEHMRLSQIFK